MYSKDRHGGCFAGAEGICGGGGIINGYIMLINIPNTIIINPVFKKKSIHLRKTANNFSIN